MATAKGPRTLPPDEVRCTATSARRRPNAQPGRCKMPRLPGLDVCYHHNGKGLLGLPPNEYRCTGTVKNREGLTDRAPAGSRCNLWALKGQRVCKLHGGGTPQARRAAAKKLAEVKLTEQANRLLVRMGADPVGNPLTALSQLAGEVLAFKEALGERVNALGHEIRYQGGAGEQLRAEVALYERAVSQASTLLANIARLNIDERLAAIEEKQIEVVIKAIDAALTYAGVTGDAATGAKKVAARHLRAV
jgi:hypothetical protein